MAKEKKLTMVEKLLAKESNQITKRLTDKIWLFHGVKGTRKTSVASLFPNHIMAAFEKGYAFVSTAKAEPMKSWSDFKNFLRALKDPRVMEMYETVVIDTIGLAYAACYDSILNTNSIEDIGDLPYGKGWRQVRKEFEQAMLTITQLGYGLVMLGHSKIIEDEAGNVIAGNIDIDKRPHTIITGLADFILFLDKELVEGPNGPEETVIAYSRRFNFETKKRCRYLADSFEFTYENLVKELHLAVDLQNANEGMEIVDEIENPHLTVQIDLEELQNEVLELGKQLTADDSPVQDRIFDIIDNKLPGINISDTKRIHIPVLQYLKEEFLAIAEEIQ